MLLDKEIVEVEKEDNVDLKKRIGMIDQLMILEMFKQTSKNIERRSQLQKVIELLENKKR